MFRLKINTIILSLLFVLNCSSYSTLAQNTSNQTTPQSIETAQTYSIVCYQVFGMDCPGCHSALEKQLKKIDGIENIEASWKKKQVIIFIDPNKEVKEEDILNHIKKANFTPGKKIEIVDNPTK